MMELLKIIPKSHILVINILLMLVSFSACANREVANDFSCKECCWKYQPKDSHKGWTAEVYYEGREKVVYKVTTDDWADSISDKQNQISKIILKDKNGHETSTLLFKNGYPIGVHPSFRNSKLRLKHTFSDSGEIILIETFWPNGQMDMCAEVIGWKKNGKFQLWDCSGKLIRDEIYEDDKLVKKNL